MSAELRSVLVVGVGLGTLAAAAGALAWGRVLGGESAIPGLRRMLAATVAVQALHFAEEAATGFHVRYPALLGQAPLPFGGFVAFNLAWLAIWTACLVGLAEGRRWPLFPLWLLALAGAANGLAHPGFALLTGGYFPGLVTAPFLGVLGGLGLRRLSRATVAAPVRVVSA